MIAVSMSDGDQPGQGIKFQPHHKLFPLFLAGYPREKSGFNCGKEALKPFNLKEEYKTKRRVLETEP